MSIIQFWKERLLQRNPLYGPFKPKEDYKPRLDRPFDTWPHSVCRADLYKAYLSWHDEVFLKAYRGVAFFDESNQPVPDGELAFYCTMSPFLYLVSKEVQVRNYLVPHTYHFENRWVKAKRYRYFIRLCEWETHVAAFELYTGLNISGNIAFFDVEKAKRMSAEIAEFKEKHAEKLRATVGG